MRITHQLTSAVLALLVAVAPAAAQDSKGPTEILLFEPPAGWVIDQGEVQNTQSRLEYRPQSEIATDWSQRIVFEKLVDRQDVGSAKYVQTFIRSMMPFCQEFGTSPPETSDDSGYDTTWLFILCLDAQPPTEGSVDPVLVTPTKAKHLILMKVIRGREALYVLRKAWQSDDPAAKSPMEDPSFGDWGGTVAAARLCDLTQDRCAP